MKVEDLRFGNWVQWKDHKGEVRIGKVQSLFPEQIGIQEKDKVTIRLLSPEEVMPIELSEFWLDKFGFKRKGGREGFLQVYNNFELGDVSTNDRPNRFYIYHGIDSRKSKYIEHVHLLQNLYFALTGEELTWKK